MKITFFLFIILISSNALAACGSLGIITFPAPEVDCKAIYPSITELLKRNKCISDQKKAEAQREEKEKREEAARICLAEQIPDTEKLIQSLNLNSDDNMNQVISKLEKLKLSPKIFPSERNIKEKEVELKLTTSCKTDFFFRIRIKEGEDKKLNCFDVYSFNPPKGYPSGHLKKFKLDDGAQKEAFKKAQKGLAETKVYESDQNSNHCAPNLSRQERINRLAKKGQIRQTSENSYNAGSSAVSFSYAGTLMNCY